MKKICLTVTSLLLVIFGLFGQKTDSYNGIPDIEAEYPGGSSSMMKFLSANLRYPEKAIKEGINGQVRLRFTIDKKGKISDVMVVNGMSNCSECETEAIRVVKKMPKWKPAIYKGEKIHSYFLLPINFRLL